MPSYRRRADASREASSRPRQETVPGRQSVLGDYWGTQVTEEEERLAEEMNHTAETEPWF